MRITRASVLGLAALAVAQVAGAIAVPGQAGAAGFEVLEPGSKDGCRWFLDDPFARSAQRTIASKILEHQSLHELESYEEGRANQASR